MRLCYDQVCYSLYILDKQLKCSLNLSQVLFSEPVVITACEFIEQNASSICPAVKLMGYGGFAYVHSFTWNE